MISNEMYIIRLKHDFRSFFFGKEEKRSIERIIQYIKDGAEGFDDLDSLQNLLGLLYVILNGNVHTRD